MTFEGITLKKPGYIYLALGSLTRKSITYKNLITRKNLDGKNFLEFKFDYYDGKSPYIANFTNIKANTKNILYLAATADDPRNSTVFTPLKQFRVDFGSVANDLTKNSKKNNSFGGFENVFKIFNLLLIVGLLYLN